MTSIRRYEGPELQMQQSPQQAQQQPSAPQVQPPVQQTPFPQAGVGPVPGAQTQAITPQNTTMYSSVTPQQTPQEQQIQNYQMNLAGQAAQTPQYNYSGIGQQQTQQGTGAIGSALSTASGTPGYGPAASYGPVTSGRADSYTQQAAGMLGGIGGAGGPSADAQALRAMLMSRVGGLEGPDRGAIANQTFQLLQDQSRPAYERELRGVGARAASLGRIGAGMTTNDLTGVQQSRDRMLSEASRGLSLDAAAKSLEDQLAKLSGTQGALGQVESADQGWGSLGLQGQSLRRGAANDLFAQGSQLRGEERENRNFNLGLDTAKNDLNLRLAGTLGNLGSTAYDMGRGLRGEQFGYDQGRFNAGLQGLGAVSGVGGQIYNQNAGYRDELRGERGYQQGLDQQAKDDAIQQTLLEESLLGGQFGRNLQGFNSLSDVGYGMANPENALRYQGQVDQGQADQGFAGAGDLLGQYFAGQVGQPGPAPIPAGTAEGLQDIAAYKPKVKR